MSQQLERQEEAEYDAEQMYNLTQMLLEREYWFKEVDEIQRNIYNDYATLIEGLEEKDIETKDGDHFKHIGPLEKQNLFEKNADFFELLTEDYKVDFEWLMNKRTEKLRQTQKQMFSEYYNKAVQIYDSFLLSQQMPLSKILEAKAESPDIKAQIVEKFKVFLAANNKVNPQHPNLNISKSNLLTECIVRQMEDALDSDDHLSEFDPVNFIAHRLEAHKNILNSTGKLPPNVTVFDENYTPFNPDDGEAKQALTFAEYQYKQMMTLKEMTDKKNLGQQTEVSTLEDMDYLVNRLSTIKRDAYLHIYNDYLEAAERKQRGESLKKGQTTPRDVVIEKALTSKEAFFDMFKSIDLHSILPQSRYPFLQKYIQRERELERARRLAPDLGQNIIHRVGKVDMNEVRADIEAQLEDEMITISQQLNYSHKITFPEEEKLDIGGKQLSQEALAEGYTIISKLRKMKDSLKPNEIKDIEEAYQTMNEEIEKWEKEYGQNLFENIPLRVDRFQSFFSDSDISLHQAQPPIDKRENVKMIDNKLMRQILDRLRDPSLRVPRIKDQILMTQDFKNELKLSQPEQYFDVEGIEKMTDNAKHDSFAFAERQNYIIQQQREQQQEAWNALNTKAEAALQVYGKNFQPMHEYEDRIRRSDFEQMQLELDQVEDKVKAKHEIEEKMSKSEQAGDPVSVLARIVAREQKLFKEQTEFHPDNVLQDFMQNDYFGALNKELLSDQCKTMDMMARNFEPFDLAKILTSDTSAGPVFSQLTPAEESADTPDMLSHQIKRAESAEQIKQAAKKQAISGKEQRFAMEFNKASPAQELYLRTQYQMFLNKYARQNLAQSILQAKHELKAVEDQKLSLVGHAERLAGQFDSQGTTQTNFSFIEADQSPIQSKDNLINALLKRIQRFSPKSENLQEYNDELMVLVQNQRFLTERQRKRDDNRFQEQVQYVMESLHQNGLKPNFQTHALLFEKSVILEEIDQANASLKKLVDLRHHFSVSPVATRDLEQFFEVSLQTDNFDGLAHLANFAQHTNLNISAWNMDLFQSPLDFYLNHCFNVSKIFTFFRFYEQFVRSALASADLAEITSKQGKLSQEEQALVFQHALQPLEKIAFLDETFDHVLEHVGTRTFIDPKTKADPLYQMVDLFTNPAIQEAQYLSSEGSTFISQKTLASYFQNHLDEASTCRRLMMALCNLDRSDNDIQTFHSQILKHLKDFKISHKRLPKSFTEKSLQDAYIHLKDASEGNPEAKMSEGSAEVLLYLFNENMMTAEAIDLCHNYHKLVKGYDSEEEANKSEIRNYHFSSNLLGLGLKGGNNYHTVLEQSVFENTPKDNSLAYLTSMTKAYLKDGSKDYALTFFHEGIEKRRASKKERDDFLVNLFDSTFANKKLTQAQFKKRYYQMMLAKEKIQEELALVQSIDEILQHCEPHEIDSIFMLQILKKEETSLLQSLADVHSQDLGHLQDLYQKCETTEDVEHFFLHMSNDIPVHEKEFELRGMHTQNLHLLDPLLANFERKAELSEILSQEAKRRMLFFNNLLTDDQREISLLKRVGSVEEARALVGQSESDFEATEKYLKDRQKKKGIVKAIKQDLGLGDYSDELNRIEMESMRQHLEETIDSQLRRTKANLIPEETPWAGEEQQETLEEMFNELYEVDIEPIITEIAEEGMSSMSTSDAELYKEWRKFEQNPKIVPENDIRPIRERIFEETVEVNYQELLNTIHSRQGAKLPMAIEAFNKIQNQKAPAWNSLRSELGLKENPNVPRAKDVNVLPVSEDQMARKLRSLKSDDQIEGTLNESDLPQSQEISFSKGEISHMQKQGISGLSQSGNVMSIGYEDPIIQHRRFLNQTLGHKLDGKQGINESLSKFKYHLGNSFSPVISNFLHLIDYRDGSDLQPMADLQDGELEEKMGQLLMQNEKLMSLNTKVTKMKSGLRNLFIDLSEVKNEISEHVSLSKKFSESLEKQRDERIRLAVGEKVDKLYNQYLQINGVTGEDAQAVNQDQPDFTQEDDDMITGFAHEMKNEDKVKLMQQAISIEGYEAKQDAVFTSFYAEDLIAFGIQNKIAEAIRLGEKMLSDLGEPIPVSLAQSAKYFKLAHATNYAEASKLTGPINFPVEQKKRGRADHYQTSSIVNMDDPYWQEFVRKNYRAQDQHKHPSMFAWDQQEGGITASLVNLRQIQQDAKEISKML